MDILNTLLQSNTFNFLIVLGVILFLLKKINIKAKINDMREQIKNYVEDSSNELNLAEKELNAVSEKLKNLPNETSEINISAKNNIENVTQQIEEEIQDKMHDIDNNAKRILNLEIKQFKSKLTGILTEKSIELAKENAMEQLKTNPQLHKNYIDEAINEIDRINL